MKILKQLRYILNNIANYIYIYMLYSFDNSFGYES